MNEKGQIQILFLIVIAMIGCGLVAGAFSWAKGQTPTTVTVGQPVGMLQPQGVNPQEDYANSQTNLNNSQSNVNNGIAAQIVGTINEQRELLKAKACQIRNDCAVQTYLDGHQAGYSDGLFDFSLGTFGAIALIGIVVVALLRR